MSVVSRPVGTGLWSDSYDRRSPEHVPPDRWLVESMVSTRPASQDERRETTGTKMTADRRSSPPGGSDWAHLALEDPSAAFVGRMPEDRMCKNAMMFKQKEMYVTNIENNAFANIMRLLAGLIDPLLSPIASLPVGAHVVQLGCGTGELSLALARRRPDLRISATDIDPVALNDGRARAIKDDLTVDFREMSMAELDFADDSVDAIISRMGLFLPGTAPFDISARESGRVLRADGILSIAIWADLADSPYTAIGFSVLRKIMPEGAIPDMETSFAEAARPALLGRPLANAGFRDIEASWFDWETEFPSFESWWAFDAEFGPLKALFDSLDENQAIAARQVMADSMSAYLAESGSYHLPARARTITARR